MLHLETAETCVSDVSIEMRGHRPTWAEIDLSALAANFHLIRREVVASQQVKICAVVKSNAYGHGAVECARVLEREGADWLGVALPEEAVELREAGISLPVLCLGGFWDGQAALCLRYKITPVVYRADMLESINAAATSAGVVANVHVKFDTGMGRLGVRFEDAPEFLDSINGFRNIRVEGLMTHFAVADETAQREFTALQTKRFLDIIELARARGLAPVYCDLSNSAATFTHAETVGNLVRPGGTLYGLWRDVLPASDDSISRTENNVGRKLRPVMSLHSRVTLLKTVQAGETIGYGRTFRAVRETRIATLPIGYNDGLIRALSNRGKAIINGSFVSLVGRVSMDLTMLDVTDAGDVRHGDVVTLFGQYKDLHLPAEDVAREAGTISYELTCGVSSRVPRVYLHGRS